MHAPGRFWRVPTPPAGGLDEPLFEEWRNEQSTTGHAEVVQVEFDPDVIGYADLLEIFFGIPGLGSELYRSIMGSDFPVVKAFTMLGAVLYVFFNILADVLYAVFDPRLRLS